MIEEVFKHSFINFELFLSRFIEFFPHVLSNYPRANGAERRSGRKPGARVTNSTLAFTYIRIMRCYIAQWHNGMKSRPPF